MSKNKFEFTIFANDATRSGLESALRRATSFGKSVSRAISAPFRALSSMRSFAFVENIKTASQIMEGFLALSAKQEQAEAKLAAILKATGHAARFTADEIKKMAAERQSVTTFGDEDIINAQAIIASFKNIKGEVFKEVTAITLDLSSAMGQDLKSSAVQLGKALNDPIAGVSALSEVGVTFSEQQRQQIKQFMQANQIMAAQRVILDELRSEFGGVAEAMAKTGSGALKQFKNRLGDLGEVAGKIFEPFVVAAVRSFDSVLPHVEAFANQSRNFVTTNFGEIKSVITGTFEGIGKSISGSFGGMAQEIKGSGIAGAIGQMAILTNEFAQGIARTRQGFIVLNDIVQGLRASLAVLPEASVNFVGTIVTALSKLHNIRLSIVEALGLDEFAAKHRATAKEFDAWIRSLQNYADSFENTRNKAKESIAGSVDEFSRMNDVVRELEDDQKRIVNQMNKWPELWRKTQSETNKQSAIVDSLRAKYRSLVDTLSPLRGSLSRIFQPFADAAKQAREQAKKTGDAIREAYQKAADGVRTAAQALRDAQDRLSGFTRDRERRKFDISIANAPNDQARNQIRFSRAGELLEREKTILGGGQAIDQRRALLDESISLLMDVLTDPNVKGKSRDEASGALARAEKALGILESVQVNRRREDYSKAQADFANTEERKLEQQRQAALEPFRQAGQETLRVFQELNRVVSELAQKFGSILKPQSAVAPAGFGRGFAHGDDLYSAASDLGEGARSLRSMADVFRASARDSAAGAKSVADAVAAI